MDANKVGRRYVRWILLPLIVLFFWYFCSPVVAVNFSLNSEEEFHYVWNTQDRIHRGDIKHGGSAVEFGYLFPDDDFFMMFDWWTDKGFQRCVDISPKWGRTLTSIWMQQAGSILLKPARTLLLD